MRIVLILGTVQLLTAGVAWLALGSTDRWAVGVCVAVAMGIGVLASVWIGTSMRAERRLLQAKHGERLSLKVAEHQRELARLRAEDSDRIAGLVRRAAASRKGLLRTGALIGGIAGVVVTMLVAQFVALGIAVALLAGGAFVASKVASRAPRTRTTPRDPRSSASDHARSGRGGRSLWRRLVRGRSLPALADGRPH